MDKVTRLRIRICSNLCPMFPIFNQKSICLQLSVKWLLVNMSKMKADLVLFSSEKERTITLLYDLSLSSPLPPLLGPFSIFDKDHQKQYVFYVYIWTICVIRMAFGLSIFLNHFHFIWYCTCLLGRQYTGVFCSE